VRDAAPEFQPELAYDAVADPVIETAAAAIAAEEEEGTAKEEVTVQEACPSTQSCSSPAVS
jgi:hypothetical protein